MSHSGTLLDELKRCCFATTAACYFVVTSSFATATNVALLIQLHPLQQFTVLIISLFVALCFSFLPLVLFFVPNRNAAVASVVVRTVSFGSSLKKKTFYKIVRSLLILFGAITVRLCGGSRCCAIAYSTTTMALERSIDFARRVAVHTQGTQASAFLGVVMVASAPTRP